MVKGWKLLALVFMFVSFMEGAALYLIWNAADEIIENENICSVNICSEYDLFSYDIESKICECYDDNNDVAQYQEYIG